jgi:hypothetical protein
MKAWAEMPRGTCKTENLGLLRPQTVFPSGEMSLGLPIFRDPGIWFKGSPSKRHKTLYAEGGSAGIGAL